MQNNDVKISVIIPVYNVEKYIGECLDYLIDQSLKDIEIICLNDGSSDKSEDVIKEYMKRDKRISLYNLEHKKQAVARNTGIRYSKGKYLLFIDSDDYISKNCCDELYNKMEKNNLDVLYFNGTTFFETPELASKFKAYGKLYSSKRQIDDILSGQDMFCYMMDNSFYRDSPCLQIYRKQYIVENNIEFLENVFYEDIYFSLKSILYAQRTMVVNDEYYHRRMRENSTTTNVISFFNIYSYLKVLNAMIKLIDELNLNEKMQKYIFIKINQVSNVMKLAYSKLDESEKAKKSDLEPKYSLLFNSIFFIAKPVNNSLEIEQRYKELEKYENSNLVSNPKHALKLCYWEMKTRTKLFFKNLGKRKCK